MLTTICKIDFQIEARQQRIIEKMIIWRKKHGHGFGYRICGVFLLFAMCSCISRWSKPIFQQLYERMFAFKLYCRCCLFLHRSFALKKINSKIFYLSFLDAIKFKETIKQDFFNEILLWTCHDECIYHCMWRTTNAFISRNWNVPQFYGKWPFKRFLGIQEPASVFFSFLNLLAHWRMIRKFRREVRNDSPMYYVWHIFNAVSKEYTCFLFETNLLAVLYK